MNGVAPIDSAPEYLRRREEEAERPAPAEPVNDEVKAVPEAKSDAAKQAEKTTLLDFQYTGKGSFIDKVF